MRRARNLALERYNSFGIAATAREAVQIEAPGDLAGLAFDPRRDLVLGGGSNLLLAGDVAGTVILNRIPGMRLLGEKDGVAQVEAGAGEIWHSLVLWAIARGLHGLENLSLIPGRTGAAPIQNIGAYGVELRDVLTSVTAWDWQQRRLVEIHNSDCRFGYRDSRFKAADADRYFITAIRLRLERSFRPRLGYAGLAEQLQAMEVREPDARQVSQAVIMLRKRKLPDPVRHGNAGSFFKNPVVDTATAERLQRKFQGLPAHVSAPGQCKLSAAWMIEHCGWKGYRDGDAGVSNQHSLVLVNHGRASGPQILDLARRVAASVHETFGVELEPEPRIVGAEWG